MATPKTTLTPDGQKMHTSVGAVIERNGLYLLIDRVKPPFGFAGLAGHVDEGESVEQAIIREVMEESGLVVKRYSLLFEETLALGACSRGIEKHYWYLFRCDTTGEVRIERAEAKSIGWYSKEQLATLNLEPVWEYWYKKMTLI